LKPLESWQSRYSLLAAVAFSVISHLLLLLWPWRVLSGPGEFGVPQVMFITLESALVQPTHKPQTGLPEKQQVPLVLRDAQVGTRAPVMGAETSESDSTSDGGLGATNFHAVHFYEKSELNRFPVLTKPFKLEIENLGVDALYTGQADVWLYISASGSVEAVRTESSSLSPIALVSVARQLKRARFKPGYLTGNPVPSKIRWRVTVESDAGMTWLSE
jgi:hypothetical protein